MEKDVGKEVERIQRTGGGGTNLKKDRRDKGKEYEKQSRDEGEGDRTQGIQGENDRESEGLAQRL